ncbi:hypothetical protein HGH92_23610 [Chitinophaga varians]|uniref:Uncharacterized protein n=1 Tax=Chitinophaga varians TaxID=2202339 RepID=A0A847RWB9_9BACT|nr:hypothetical protein [Chitinophaga varians]NLR67312.1 hypothetical protein [Chitinophaga varians]
MNKEDYNIKEYSLVYGLSGSPKKILQTVFGDYDLDGLKHHFEYWKYAALGNNISLYDCGKERRMLIGFCEDLEKVLEAFYVLSKHKKKQLERIPSEHKKIWKKCNKCSVLSKDEKKNPDAVLKLFSKKYKRLYAKAELVEMFECVITLEKGDRGHLNGAVSFFMCVDALLSLLYL